MFFDLDVIPALAGKQPGLLFYRVEVAVQFVLAGAKIRRAAAGADRHADPAAHLGLPGIIAVAVLLAFQRQVTAHVDGNLFSAGLRAGQPGVAAAGHLEITARIQGGFGMRQAVAVLMPLAGIDAGRDADAVPARACADADTDVAAFAAVLADGAFAVLRRLQGNVPRRIERQVFARFQLAAGDDDIATLRVVVLAARRYRQVLPGGERAALRLVAVGAGFALRRLAAVGGADTHRIGGALRRTFVSRLQAGSGVFRLRRGGQRIIPLPGLCSLHAGQRSLGVLQRGQAPIAFFSRLLRRADGGVERAAHGARQCHAQAALLLLVGLFTRARINAGIDSHAVAGKSQILGRHQIGAADVQLVARRDVDAALTAADGADALALGPAFLVDFVFARLFANGEADAAAAQQAAFFLLFQPVMRVGLGGRADVDVTAGLQVHVLVGGNGRAGDRQIVAGADADAVAAEQATFLACGGVMRHTVAAAFFQETFFL